MGIRFNRWLIATGLVLGLAGPLRASNPTYGQNFGLSGAITASGTQITVNYFGWEASTVYGHTLWAFTSAQYAQDLSNGCYSWVACGSIAGTNLFTKPYGVSPFTGDPTSPMTFTWDQGTEIIFGLMVNQNDGYNWFFSGAPSRNGDGLAHLAYFPADLYPSGVPGTGGVGFVPGTAGENLYGFEDVIYQNSDWDFNNSLFTLDGTSGPTEVIPEPVTLTLLGTGLAGLGALRRRRRRSDSAPG